MIKDVMKDDFEREVIASSLPVLVDFWGPRCTNCLALMPDVEEMASRYSDVLKVVTVDASQNRRLCLRLRVLSLPTYLLYKDGKEVDRLVGEVTRERLKAFVSDFVESRKGER